MHACTIAARNYLAQVRVLAETFLAAHPSTRLSVLVIDAEPGESLDIDAPYRVLTPAEAGIGDDELHRMALIYDVTELATAVKPMLLRHLLDEATDAVVMYLDPDTVVYDDLGAVEPMARAHGIVLAPHVLHPLPRDGRGVNEQVILQAGVFNLGFIAVGHRARPFLDWWAERTRTECCSDVAAGMFTDQRWVDFVPVLFDHVIWRDPGVDVAYWNLHERPLTRAADGRMLAGGQPLRVMHFSGYDPDRPHWLSKHQGPAPRILLSTEPVLADLAHDYRRRLLDAGLERWRRVPYRFGTVAGHPLPLDVRRLARNVLVSGDPLDAPPPSPFASGGAAPFIEWLNQPMARHGDDVVTRLQLHVWHRRVDLQIAFPEPETADLGALSSWAPTCEDTRARYGPLHDPPLLPLPAPRGEPAEPGVNIVGYLRAELGVGEAGRRMALAAEAAAVPHRTVAYRVTRSRQLDPFAVADAASSARPYSVNVLCANADVTARLLADLPPELLAGRYRVGLWFWEVEQAPPHGISSLPLLDELWVASDFVADVFRPHTDRPVLVTPLAVPMPVPTRLRRADLGLPVDRRVFLCCFDAFSVPERKNPLGVVQAYRAAFTPGDGAHLVVKVTNGASQPEAMERLWYASRDRSDIEIRDRYLSRAEMNALVQLCDAYVSLHRSEGFGLNMAAAMAASKPVVATAYSGNMAFMHDDDSLLVPYDLVPVGAGNEPYAPDARWAEPDLDVAARHLAHIIDDPVAARARGRRARAAVARTHGPDVAGAWLARRIDEIVGGTRGPGPVRTEQPLPSA